MATAVALFKEKKLVPGILKSIPDDMDTIDIDYGNGHKVNGTELTPTQVKDKPKVSFKADPNALYTLIFTDPDTPRREFKHWVVVNIPGNDVDKGREAAAYVGAGPPQCTGLHRYTFVVFKQTAKLDDSSPVASDSLSGRLFFSTAKFAEQNGLEGPIAGNLFESQYDDYVPVIHRNFYSIGSFFHVCGSFFSRFFC